MTNVIVEYIANTMKHISVWELVEVIVIAIGVISVIVEKSKKLPFNPWSKLYDWLNKPIYDRITLIEKQNKDTNFLILQKFEELEKRMDDKNKADDEKEAKRLRTSIIVFSDSCRVGDKHTKTHFENVFRDYDDYMDYCTRHKFENHFIDEEMDYIHNVYNECLKDNKFL